MKEQKTTARINKKNNLKIAFEKLLVYFQKLRHKDQTSGQPDVLIRQELKRVNQAITDDSNEINTKRLEQLIYLKDLNHTYSKRGFPYSILLTIIIVIAGIYLIQRCDSTTVSIDLDVSSVYARTLKELNLVRNSNNFLNETYGQISFNGRLDNSAYGNVDNENVTIRNSLTDNSLFIKNLNIPKMSEMVISRPIEGDLNVDIKQKSNNQVRGQIFLDEGVIVTDREVKLGKSKDVNLASPHVIDFTKTFDDNDVFILSLSNARKFQLSRLYIDSIAFTESNTTNDIHHSSILSGTIRLLETDGDSIVLSENDSLNIMLQDDPARVSITVNDAGIHVTVEAEVSRLIAGSSILLSGGRFSPGNKLNKMPMRYKTMSYLVPYVIAVLSGIAPILFTMIMKPGKALL